MTNKISCQITCHGQTKTAEALPGESLLEVALKLGLEPPYSCLEGVCGTCQARVEKGEVIPGDDITSLPSDSAGVLIVKTCMTRPKSDIQINYDKA